MLGVGKKSKKARKEDRYLKAALEDAEPKLEIVDNRSEMALNKFELYFRVYLLVKYYYGLFAEINQDIRTRYGETTLYLTYLFKPDSTEPEGRLFQMLDFLKPNAPNAVP